MAVYKILFKESAEKDLKKIPKTLLKNIIRKISALENNPYHYGYVKLSGSEGFYRIRTGDYRVIYSADNKAKVLTVWYIRHRKDVYKSV